MKKLMFIVLAAVLIFFPVKSFALVDASLYGGYTFSGELKAPAFSTNPSLTGMAYGGRAHFTGAFIILDYGIGGFVQYSPLEYKFADRSYNSKKTDYGIDAFVGVWIIPLIEPYVRGGYSFYQKVDVGSDSVAKWFPQYYYGAGLALKLPLPVLKLQLFVEYLRSAADQKDSIKLIGNTVNAGVTVGI